MTNRRIALAAAACAVLAMPAAAQADGAVRVLHASPNAPAVDVYVDGAAAVKGLKRGTITGYLEVAGGKHTYAIRVAGTPKRSAPVAAGSFRVADGKAVTVAATGFVAQLRVRAYNDLNVTPFGAAKIRVSHLSPDTPKVDVYVRGTGKVVSGLAYSKTSAYLTLPAGSYTFDVRVAGAKATSKPALTLKRTLSEGGIYDARALGSLTGKGLSLRLVTTHAQLPASFARTQVRVLHASPGAPAVDVYVGDSTTPLIDALVYGTSFPKSGGYAVLPSGPITLKVRADGAAADSPALYETDLTLAPKATVTVAARGVVGSGATPFALQRFADDVRPLAAGKARLTVVHLSPGTPNVDVFAGASRVVKNLPYGAAATPLVLAAGTLDALSAAPAGGAAGTIPIPPLTLTAGRATTVYALGLLGGTPPLSFGALRARVG